MPAGGAFGAWSPRRWPTSSLSRADTGGSRLRGLSAYAGPMHDESYKRFFAFPRMVEDLLRVVRVLPPGDDPTRWIDDLDFTTLEKLSAEYLGDDLRKRYGDLVWRVRFRGRWLHLLVLLEFQSTDDAEMALRILEYTVLLYRELVRNRALGPSGRCPAVVPVVVYNGDTRWQAAREVRDLIEPVEESVLAYQPSRRYILVDERLWGQTICRRGT